MSIKRLLSALVIGFIALAGSSCVGTEGDPSTGEVDQAIAPPPPMNLTVTNLQNTYTPAQQLNWTPSAGATQYVIYRGTAGPGSETTYQSCCTGGPPFLANHLTAATNYCWQVRAANSIGQLSAASNEVCLSTDATVTVTPPATVSAVAVSASRINVSWSAVTNASSYQIYESVGGGAFNLATTVSSPGTSVARINLQPSTNYCYTVATVSPAGTSVQSSPPACDTTFALGLEGYWRLTETTGTTAADQSGFNRSLTLAGGAVFDTTGTPQAPIDPPLGNQEPHLDSGAGTGQATSASGISAYRFVAPFSIQFWVYPVAAGNLKLAGMRVAGNCTGAGAGWEISQGASGLQFIGQSGSLSFGQSLTVAAWTHVAVTFDGTTMRAYINGAQVASGAYTAANSLGGTLSFGHVAGCSSAQAWFDEAQVYSRQLSASEVATFGTRPPAPTALTMTKNTSTSQYLSWTAPATGADRWIILRGLSSGTEKHYTHAPNPPTTFTADHLASNTTYFWEVETVQNHLISVPSNEVTNTTLAAPPAPTGVTATATSQTRITVAWQAVPNATDYFVYMATTQAGPYSQKAHVTAPTLSAQVINLTANTTYWFEVQDKDSGQQLSPFSTQVSATTLP